MERPRQLLVILQSDDSSGGDFSGGGGGGGFGAFRVAQGCWPATVVVTILRVSLPHFFWYLSCCPLAHLVLWLEMCYNSKCKFRSVSDKSDSFLESLKKGHQCSNLKYRYYVEV